MKVSASTFIAFGCLAWCAAGCDEGAPPSAPSAAGARVGSTTITLPPHDAIPVGAPVIVVPETGGPERPAASAADELLGASEQASGAEAVVRSTLYPRARACYGSLRARARVVLALQVRPNGSVAASTAEVAEGLPAEAVQCIEASAKNLIFVTPGRRGAAVTVPMRFSPDAGRGLAYDAALESAVQSAVVPAVLGCYEAAGDDGGQGAIDFVVTIGAGGVVRDVRGARDASVGAGVATCAADKLRAVHFDLAAGRAIDVPIELRHAGATSSR